MLDNTSEVLIVEDSLEDRKTYIRYLLQDQHHTYNVLEAETGEKGLEWCRQQCPDVIIVDYLLPDMNGLEFLRSLQTQLGDINLPVIVLTGQGNEQIAVEAMKHGVADYLVKKNTTPESLCVAIQTVLEETGLRQQIEATEKRFQNTFEQAAVGIAHIGLNGEFLLVNQKLCDIVGYSREELEGLTWQQITHPDELTLDWEYIRQMLAGEIQRHVFEKCHIRKDKTHIWINVHVSLVRSTLSEPYFIYVVQDVTTWKQRPEELQHAYEELETQMQQRTLELQQVNEEWQQMLEELQVTEEELRQQNEELAVSRQAIELERQRYQDLFEFAPDGYLVTDMWGKILEANQAVANLLSRSQQLLIGKPLSIFIAKKERKTFHTRLAQLQYVHNWETYLEGRSGVSIPVMVAVTTINDDKGEQVALRWLLRDISARKQIEQELQAAYDQLERRVEARTAELFHTNQLLQQEIGQHKQSEAQITFQASLLNQVRNAVIATDLEGKIIYWNQFAQQLYQFTQEDMGRSILEVTVPEENLEISQQIMTSLQATGMWAGELMLRRRDGSIFPADVVNALVRDQAGNPCGIVGVSVDITERKQAQQTISEQAALLNVASDAIFVRNLKHQILFWNQAAENLYGWQNSEVLGKTAIELFCLDIAPQVEELLKIVLEQGKWEGELQHITKDGKKVIVLSRWTLVTDNTGQPKSILTVNTDITQKKQLEAQFYQVQRLESLGTLASGIAHDLNNILTPILAVAQLLPIKLSHLDEKDQQLLKILEDSSIRGTELVKQITSIASGREGKRVPTQLNNLIKEVERIVSGTFPKLIEIRTNLAQGLWTVLVDETQIHQVLMNLCVNARDAMPQGGILSISTENFIVDQHYARMHLEASEGSYVVITVSDTGYGIPKEVLERIFEPFFTTKEQGKGTGLGLSTVLGIIKNHGGFVNAYSEVGEGSEFQVYLPAMENKVTQQEVNNFQMLKGNNELILVVDDEEFIREICKTSLEEHNYKVLTARDAVDAFSLYTIHKNEISIVLIDIQMPSIDGFNAIRVLQQINSSVKIIAMSGLASNRKLLEINDLNVEAFLLKPYTIETLLSTIQRVL